MHRLSGLSIIASSLKLSQDQILGKDANHKQDAGDHKNDERQDIVFLLNVCSDQRRSHQPGKARRQVNQKEAQGFKGGESGDIHKNIFWQPRYEKKQENDHFTLLVVEQEAEPVDFGLADQRRDDLIAQEPGRIKSYNSADHDSDDGIQGSKDGSEDVSAGYLYKFSGDGCNNDLQHLKAYKNQDAQSAIRINKITEMIRIAYKSRNGGRVQYGQRDDGTDEQDEEKQLDC